MIIMNLTLKDNKLLVDELNGIYSYLNQNFHFAQAILDLKFWAVIVDFWMDLAQIQKY